jgi:DUF4097 and DUF4098 domain-containing protein YvlB
MKKMLLFLLPATLQAHFLTFWQQKESFTKEYTSNGTPAISVTIDTGEVTIDTWDKKSIEVYACKEGSKDALKATKVNIKNEPDGSAFAITTSRKDEQDELASSIVHLTVPENCSAVTVVTKKGNITITDVRAPLRASTKEGNIEIHNSGSLYAATEVGSISIKNSRGSVEAHTQKGNIKIRQKTLAPETSFLLDTLAGDVSVWLPRKANVRINAKTETGTVTCEHAITLEPQTVQLNRETWEQFKKEAYGTMGTDEKKSAFTVDVTKGTIRFLITQVREE